VTQNRPSRAEASPGLSGLRTFAALRHRNYRLWFAGQIVSLFGTWMQSTAQGFLVFELTRSPAYLGYVGFAAGVPVWLFMLYGGVTSDRAPRRTVLLVTQTSMMLLAFVLAGLTFSGLVRPWHILVLASGLGLANAFDAPARQAFVSELVDRRDLTNAIALNSTMFNSAFAVGPAIAGVTYKVFGPGWCFAVNGLSFVAVIAALAAMRLKPQPLLARGASVGSHMKEALLYVVRDPTIRTLIGLLGIVGWFGVGAMTLLPAWAVTILGGDATTNGLLQSARGAGALVSALTIATLGRFNFKGRLLTLGTFAFPVFLFAFALARWLPLSLLLLGAVGAAQILINNLTNALVQTLVPDSMRGRVMGVYTLTFFGSMPLGALWIGMVAQRLGEPNAIMLASLAPLGIAGLLWVLAPKVRALE
jgi:MFS family permease